MTWHLRRAVPGDAPALSLVAGATFLETFHAVVPVADLLAHVATKSSAAEFRQWIDDGGSAVLHAVADFTGAPIGYAVLTAPDFPIVTDPRDIELRRLYTLAATHGTGLGASLMQMAIDEARSMARTRILLGVHPDNHRARRFYERSGFCVIGNRAFSVGTAQFVDPIYALPL